MGIVIRFKRRRHARASSTASRKSSAVTRSSVTDLIATARSFDSQTFPLRNRETVVRSHLTPTARMREAIASSSKSSSFMNFDNCMIDNVHTMHDDVNGVCAVSAVEPSQGAVHNAHVARRSEKLKSEQRPVPRSGPYFREYRKAARLSQGEAAERMGYAGHTTLSKIESGKVDYTKTFLEDASRVYGVSIWHLLYCPPNTPLAKALEIWTKSVE